MRKIRIYILMILALVLTGCGKEAGGETVPPETTEIVSVTTVPEEIPTTAATETTVPPETVPPVETAAELPYLQKISHGDQHIYDGPGYDYGFAGTVRKEGIYTITEEAVDHEGNLWGRLKSGIGWVDLTQIRSEAYESALLSAGYAEGDLLRPGACHYYSCGEDYSIPIAFRAYGQLRDVTIFRIGYNAEGEFPAEDLFTLAEMTEQLPLVAELAFPGDMSMYGIRFTDEAGVLHTCKLYISGRNGALMLEEA